MSENIHTGHRERVRQEFLELGADSFSDVRALELLLFYAIPRVDVNPIAHRLLSEFKTLHNVLSASVDELVQLGGVDRKTAILIRLVGDINKKALKPKDVTKVSISSSIDLHELLTPYFMNSSSEKFCVVCLKSNNAVIKCTVLSEGVVNSVNVDMRQIVELAIANKAARIAVAHNHPTGDVEPSDEDIRLTVKIKKLMSSININLLDHIIISGESYYSFSDNGCI